MVFDQHPLINQLINDPAIIDCVKENLINVDCKYTEAQIDSLILKVDDLLEKAEGIPSELSRRISLTLAYTKELLIVKKCFYSEACAFLDAIMPRIEKMLYDTQSEFNQYAALP